MDNQFSWVSPKYKHVWDSDISFVSDLAAPYTQATAYAH